MKGYDTVEVAYPLPDAADPMGGEYRTRDLGRAGRRYRLDGSGQLWLERWTEEARDPGETDLARLRGRERGDEGEWIAWPFGGLVRLYARRGGVWRAYVACFRRGKCVQIETVALPLRGATLDPQSITGPVVCCNHPYAGEPPNQ